ncbi:MULTISPECIES: catalase [Nocardia]|uniref:catalase n=1 Tax=Nocardia TaxID=1817 RepID=UPI0007EB7354|nr:MULTISPECIES: catalase [Nocardia]MBF6273410.1 catalase [Nocardia nova]OBA50234.1 catalase HPII [Nocardia sp. 852002-51101_SCH5132738]OBB48824.1 catalase HPII [Nocardia sp. 852002-51244_SCH5132740]OBF75239.1 catalase HPII [Mycobacterium sp. 852002-51759_SCH5129042]
MTDDVAGRPGNGGETHQEATGEDVRLTTQQGVVVGDDQNTLRAGERGPALLEDFHFREKIFHFDHERIPERVVHARGFGVHGYFENYDSLSDLTRADPFQEAGRRTEAFVRFSTVAGNKGSFDLARDVRGFAVKLYTREGNWDLVGNNIPVFFIQDPIKFPDMVHAAKQEPDRGFPQAQTAHDNFWDFVSLTPESTHMLLWIMSDRAIPRSFRFMEGFGVHTFRLVNAEGRSTFVKFHWKPKQGMQSVVWNEALKINGADPDFHRRDLWDAIQSGDYPEWELGMQLFDDDFADRFAFDILDPTKIIPEEEVPVRPVGKLVLNRVVDNFFAETEQVAFCTQNIIPGIDFTNDPLLQGRNFSYLDTQLKRLGGPNFTHLPVNAPKCPFATFQQDGHMAMVNPKGRANYEPNSWPDEIKGPREDPERGFTTVPETVSGPKRRLRAESFADHYSQARQFYVSQTSIEQRHIVEAFVFELSKCDRVEIRARVVAALRNVHEDLATAVADGLGLAELPEPARCAREPITDLAPSPALSIVRNGPDSIAGRKIGVLVTDGVDAEALAEVREAVQAEKAILEIVAPKVGGVTTEDGKTVEADQKIDGGPSVLYDAVVILASEAGAAELATVPPARDFVSDAYAHGKFIAHRNAGALFAAAGLTGELDAGVMDLAAGASVADFLGRCREVRYWARF